MRYAPDLSDSRVQAALEELRVLVAQHFPMKSSSTFLDAESEAIFLRVVVDIDDPDEVVDLVIDRMQTFHLDEGLPIYVLPVRTPERQEAMIEARQSRWPIRELSLAELD